LSDVDEICCLGATVFFSALMGLTALSCGTDAAAEGGESVAAPLVTSFEIGTTVCGGSPKLCQGEEAVVVDFDHARLERHTCAERNGPADAGTSPIPPDTVARYGEERDDLITVELLSQEKIEAIRAALGHVRFVSRRDVSPDGLMHFLHIESSSGQLMLSPDAHCGDYRTVIAGFASLQDAIAPGP
jgi:hypothetical protein